jgi:hypothetical protein
MVVWAGGVSQAREVDAAGHAQVGQHGLVIVQPPDDEFGPPADVGNTAAEQPFPELGRRKPVDAARPADSDTRNGAAHQTGGPQIIDDRLNFRQFRHDLRLSRVPATVVLILGCPMRAGELPMGLFRTL